MFTAETANEIEKVAQEFGIEPAALLAVAEIESGGSVFAMIDGRQEPLIRFEGHYFDRRLSGDAQARARAEGLASPNAGEVANPASQAARWRLLARAAEIDRKAAYESVSWGLGQVMGAHWAWLGFRRCRRAGRRGAHGRRGTGAADGALHREIGTDGGAAQPRLGGFRARLQRAGLQEERLPHEAGGGLPAARGRRKAGRARRAPAVRRRCSAEGSAGEAVRDLQQNLSALGYPLAADGIFGKDTEAAVRAFQRDHELGADGVAGPRTLAAIGEALPFGAMVAAGCGDGRAMAWRGWMLERRAFGAATATSQREGDAVVRPLHRLVITVLLTG